MNWGRAKTILTTVFLIVDIFLLFVLLQTRQNLTRLSTETILATSKILQNNNIIISEENIPRKRAKNQNIIMRNYFEEPVEAAAKLLGTFETVISDDEKHEHQFKSDNRELYINENGFVYTNQKTPALYKVGETVKPETIQKDIKAKLKKFGFYEKDTIFYGGYFENGIYYCQVAPLYKDMKIYGISMKIRADKEAILGMEGNWFQGIETEAYEEESLLDITTILSSLIYREDHWPEQILQIENAFYAAGDYLSSREIAVVPVYAITDAEGNTKCFDARVGNETN